jgi:hypothetical protein
MFKTQNQVGKVEQPSAGRGRPFGKKTKGQQNRKRLAWCPGRKKGKTQEQDSGEQEQFFDTYKWGRISLG